MPAWSREPTHTPSKVLSASAPRRAPRFVRERTAPGAKVFTDDANAYEGLGNGFDHETVRHSVGEYVRGMAHTNGIESFWSMLKRAHKGTFHPERST